MSQQTSLNMNLDNGVKYHVPLKWSKEIDINFLIEYFIQLKMNQVNIKNFDNLCNLMQDDSETDITEVEGLPKITQIIESRIKNVEKLIKICKKYNIKNETFFMSVSIFDNFLSKTQKRIKTLLEEMWVISIVSLNLACKFEEVNCNYLKFFKENLVDKQINTYDIKMLTNLEMEILKTLNFKIDIPNFYMFNNINMQIAISYIYKENILENNENIERLCMDLFKHNDYIMKKFVLMKESIFSSALNSGIVCFKMTLLSMKLNGNIHSMKINDFVDTNFSKIILKEEYMQRCDYVSSNIFRCLFLQGIEKKKETINSNSNSRLNLSKLE